MFMKNDDEWKIIKSDELFIFPVFHIEIYNNI